MLSRFALLAACLAACGGAGTDSDDRADCGAPCDDIVSLDQGWTAAERDLFSFTGQGSRLIPSAWFRALERPDSDERIAGPTSVRELGYLPAAASAGNPDGLPVGFVDTQPDDDEPAWVGITCAACHTRDIQYRGTVVRIMGAGGTGDLEALLAALAAGLDATLADDAKLERFAQRVGEDDVDRLRAEISSHLDRITARIERSTGPHPAGAGRTDALTLLGNEIACTLLGIPENCAAPFAPVDLPFVWGSHELEWVQYIPVAHVPLFRNVGQAMGAFTDNNLSTAGIETSIDLDGVFQLEQQLASLTAPAWPEEIFGAIDTDRAGRGKAIYEAECASCHELAPYSRTEPNPFGQSFVISRAIPVTEVGTDPSTIAAFSARRALPGPFADKFDPGEIATDGTVPAPKLFGLVSAGLALAELERRAPSDEEKLAFLDGRDVTHVASIERFMGFKTRPLPGIAFTAPYLHNGSVPTLYDLLLPPGDRPTTFATGGRELDPDKVGLRAEDGGAILDTTLPGNSNAGHLWGTDLADTDRLDLLEFLKTL